MPMSYVLGCELCGQSWRFLRMKNEAFPPCPKCGNSAEPELPAPGVSRGATAPTSWAVPQTQAKREALAYQIAEEQGATNIRTGQREGDNAAIVPAANPNENLRPRFESMSSNPEDIHNKITALAGGGGGPAARINRGILSRMQGR